MAKHRHNPFLKILLPFILGIILSRYLSASTPVVFALSLLVGVVIAMMIGTRLFVRFKHQRASFYIIIFLFIAGYTHYCNANILSRDERSLLKLKDRRVTYYAEITNFPKIGKTVQCRGNLLSYQSDTSGTFKEVSIPIQFYLEKDSITQLLLPGARILSTSVIRIPKGSNAPFAFDFAAYLRDRHVHFQSYMPRGQIHGIFPPESKLRYIIRHRFRLKCILLLARFLEGKNLGICTSLILGYRNYLDDRTKREFADTGAIHVLAVSGLHVGIVAYAVLALLKILLPFKPVRRFWITPVIVILLFGFAELTGSAPPVVRAAILMSLYLIGKILSRTLHLYNLLAFTAFIILLLDPNVLFNVSFQLSFAAVISIVFFYPFIHPLARPGNLILRYTWQIMAVSLAAQVLTFPITIFYFHQFPIYFIVSSIAAIFFAYVLLSLGMSLILADFISTPLATYIGKLLSWCAQLFNNIISWIDHLPFKKIQEIWWGPVDLILIYFSLVALMIFLTNRKFIYMQIFLSGLLIHSVFYATKEVLFLNQVKITHYESAYFCADLFIGKHAYEIRDGDIPPDQLAYLTANNRMAHGISSVSTVEIIEKN